MNDTFSVEMQILFFTSKQYDSLQNSVFTARDRIYMEVSEVEANPLFRFIVEVSFFSFCETKKTTWILCYLLDSFSAYVWDV